MEIRIRSTGQVMTIDQFRAFMGGISIPPDISVASLNGHDADPVLEAPAPAVTSFQTAERNGVVKDAKGNWVQAWKATNWTQAQIDAHKAAAKESKWDAIKAERDRRKAGGAKVLVGGVDKWFHTDADSRIQQIGLVMMGVNVPQVPWKTMDGSFVTMTQAIAGDIFLAVAALDQSVFAKAEQHKAAMEASPDPAAYNHATDWPLTYGE